MTPILVALSIALTLPAAQADAPTDDDGRFTFDRVAPGRYRIAVQKAGFATDAPMPGTTPRPPVVLDAGQRLDVGDIALDRGGAIAGRVLDPTGEPLTDVRVMAVRRLPRGRGPSPSASAPPMVPIGQASQTNDLGEFRIFGLPVGEYFVAATPQSRFGAATNATSVFTATYFPGTRDADGATAVTVASGQTVNGIELRLFSVAAYRVSGIVVDDSGKPAAGAMVMLRPDATPIVLMGPIGNGTSGDDGRFVIGGVPAGTYRASASLPIVNSGGGIVSGVVSGIVGGMPAGTEVVVADANATGVRIVVQSR
jgi:carboxypeptidase family protein